MSLSNNYVWGAHSNESSNNKRQDASNLNSWQQIGVNTQSSWQQVSGSPQPTYAQQYGNWNSPQKSTSPQMNYKGDGNLSWNIPHEQVQFMQQQQQQYRQQPLPMQYTSNSQQFFENTANPPPPDKVGQMNFNTSNVVEQDPWNWGWDEPNNVSSYSANNNILHDSSNNCNVEEASMEQTSNVCNPVQNYFQQRTNFTGAQPSQVGIQFDTAIEHYKSKGNPQISSHHQQEYVEKQNTNDDQSNSAFYTKPEQFKSNLEDALAQELSIKDTQQIFDVKSESEQSFQDSSIISEPKNGALSSDSNKVPLTTQALKDFCDEKYENGSIDEKLQNSAKGLTPQWSIESQMSQETVSDDIPPTVPDVTQNNYSTWDVSGHQQENPRAQPLRSLASFTSNSENQEISPRPDRNQYLETGQLDDHMESGSVKNDTLLNAESLPPPGLSRLVPGEIQPNNVTNVQSNLVDISSPPPGLDRMVLGQITENETGPLSGVFRISQITPPPGLHRMVPGQLTDDQSQNLKEDTKDILSTNARRDDIPPPGFHRMIPGESSSPETQNIKQIPVDPIERRVVTGVAKDELNMSSLQANLPSPSPTPANRLTNQPASPDENRLQFQSERSETIGSDNVDTYGSNSNDVNSSKLGKRKEGKERDRHQEDVSSDETEREPGRRHERDSEYYSKRDRNREREDSSGERYRDEGERRSKGRERVDWERERRKNSPGRYREERSRRRDYREDRRRHKDYDYSDDDDDEDRDTNGYYSDRERHIYRDDYDRGYSRREDRARSLRPEKPLKGSNDESSQNSSFVSYPLQKYLEQTRYLSEIPCGKSWPDKLALSLPIDIWGSGKSRKHGGYAERERDLDREKDRDRERDRERDRDRNRNRGKDRDRQSDYYRRRDDLDDYRDSQRSRPSSRNDSVQDYKHRSGRSDYDEDRDKDKSHYRGNSKRDRDRDMFYAPGYNYDPTYYSYYYQYYENLRRTNPVAYAEWFRKYYAQSQQGTFDGTYTEDRGSVHSGRSSANEESKNRYIKTDAVLDFGYPSYQSLIDQNYPYRSHSSDAGEHETGRRLDSLQMESVQRLTPSKFTTAHVKGGLTPRGQLVKILPHYPLDGQPATVEIHENLNCFDDVRKELLNFPGPLVKGVTHKNNILRYCKQKIKDADSNPELFDKESYKLIWELLILLIRQNGTIVGTDIAELLMSNRTSRVYRQQTPSSTPSACESANQSSLTEEEVTNQFRDYLIYGNTKEALEWAMKHGLWGHALFLASKMDQRTYASVMTRFANGLTMNDPLQTLYQLMSGRQPASVTCCADEKWGDWRPHLAMILSNSTARPDLDVKAVTTLGDTLGSRGNLHAAHFCYLMAQVEFGTFAHKSSKIVLIGSSHTLSFQQFANNEAIFATEIFEFACSLADPDFALHHLQVYKLLMAKRLTEVGLVQEAVHYAEVIANTVAKFPAQYSPHFIQEVYNLGNMLKYYDPVYNNSEGAVSDPKWLLQLLNILNDYQMGVLHHDSYGSVSNLTTYSENEGTQPPLDSVPPESSNDTQAWQAQQQIYYEQQQRIQQPQTWPQNDQATNNAGFLSVEHPGSAPPSADSSYRPYWTNQNKWMQPQATSGPVDIQPTKETDYLSGVGVEAPHSDQNSSFSYYYDSNKHEKSPKCEPSQSQPAVLPGTVTLPNHRQRTVSQSAEDLKPTPQQSKPKPAKKDPVKPNQSTGSWFGGIWNKLPFRPKNQMILPDDKNPSIVWDSDKNRWVNLNSDEDDTGGPVPPPPKASELPGSIPRSAPAPAPAPAPALAPAPSPHTPATPYTPNTVNSAEASDRVDASTTPSLPPSGPNKYKMARGKSLRSNYVDVLNPGSTKTPAAAPPGPELFLTMNYSSQLPTNYFIPAPVEGNENAPIDFLSPSNAPVLGRSSDNDSAQPQQTLSRWSSTSSLSREVQKYTMIRGGNSKVLTQGSLGEDYYGKGNGQWSGGSSASRYPPSQTGSLHRSKGYTK